MRAIPATITAARAKRAGMISHFLLWIVARDRDTGEDAPIGLWTGDDHREFSIRGEARLYYGRGGLLEVDPFVHETGVTVREHVLRLAGLSEAAQQAMRGYDARLAPVEIHRAEFDADTHQLLAEPVIELDGEIDAVTLSEPREDGEPVTEVTALSNAALLTRPLPVKRSDESLRARAPDDAFLQYAKISASKGDAWGAE